MLGGLLLTLFSSLWLILSACCCFPRVSSRPTRGQQLDWPARASCPRPASSLYLFSYYLGSSMAGTLGGVFWHNYGWNGVWVIALMLLAALLTGACLLKRLK